MLSTIYQNMLKFKILLFFSYIDFMGIYDIII